MKKVYLDGDVLCYQAAGASQTQTDVENFLARFLSNCTMALSAEAVPVLTHPASDKRMRYHWGTTKPYQANRRIGGAKVSPALKNAAYAFLASRGGIVTQEYEADDILAAQLDAGHAVWTVDKDLRQVPGYHVAQDFSVTRRGHHGEGDPGEWYGAYQARYQFLIGDKTDNIPPVLGYTPTKAAKAVLTPGVFREALDALPVPRIAEQMALVLLGTDLALLHRRLRITHDKLSEATALLLEGPPPID